MKLRLGGFYGGYESADYPAVNHNTIASAQKSAWLAPRRIDEQYARAKYNPSGAIYRQWPERRRWSQLYLKLTHFLNRHSGQSRTRTNQAAACGRATVGLFASDQRKFRAAFCLRPFYQRPSWTKIFGFPFVNYTEDPGTVLNP